MAGADAGVQEGVGQPVGVLFQSPVGQLDAAEADGDAVGVVTGGDPVQQPRGTRCGRRVPGSQDEVAFGRRQDVDVGGPVGPGESVGEGGGVVVEQAVDAVGVEQLGGVFDGDAQAPVGGLFDVDGEIEAGVARGDIDGFSGDGAEGQLGFVAGGLEGEAGLEQGVAAGDAVGLEGVDDQAEGDVLVRGRVQDGVVAAADEVGEGGVAVQVGAQHDGVGEVADQGLDVGAGAAGEHGPDGQVGSAGVAVQDDQQGGMEDGEEGDAVVAGVAVGGGGQVVGQGPAGAGAGAGGLGRAGPVGGDVEGG